MGDEQIQLTDTAAEPDDRKVAALVLRAQAGDRDAFGALYSHYFESIYSYMRLMLRDEHEAQDAAQQLFCNLLETLCDYKPRAGKPFRAWLFVVARNFALNQLRKLNRLEAEDPAEIDNRRERTMPAEPDLQALTWISDAEMMLFIERLPIPQRQVVALRFMLDLRTSQVAQILDRPPAEISKLQHKALTFLKKRLIAVGRDPKTGQPRSDFRPRPKQAVVLRERRFVLYQ